MITVCYIYHISQSMMIKSEVKTTGLDYFQSDFINTFLTQDAIHSDGLDRNK